VIGERQSRGRSSSRVSGSYLIEMIHLAEDTGSERYSPINRHYWTTCQVAW
jgi:hypothetical protein